MFSVPSFLEFAKRRIKSRSAKKKKKAGKDKEESAANKRVCLRRNISFLAVDRSETGAHVTRQFTVLRLR